MRLTFLTILVLIPLLLAAASAQETKTKNDKDETCPGPVYEPKEVTRRAKIKVPEVTMTDEARTRKLQGTVSLTAVLCRTGRVTDIEVVQGLPYGMTERVVEALRDMKFTPAEKDGEEVSQRLRAEFNFNMY